MDRARRTSDRRLLPSLIVRGAIFEIVSKRLVSWRAQKTILVGSVSDLGNIPSYMSVIRLEDEQAVAEACLSRLGRTDTVVVANAADGGKNRLGLSALAPWAALQKHAALLLTNSEGTDAAEVVQNTVRRESLKRADAVLLVADFQAIPPEKRQNPSISEKEPTIEVEPLTPHGTEPYTFAVGRLIHDDPAVPLLMLARERLLSESHNRRRALVASNSGGGLPLLETFSRNTVSELRNAGYETTASFGNDVNAADLRKALVEQDIFLWEGHHSVLARDYEFPAWDEPTRPSLVFLQSCLALKEDEAGPMLRRGVLVVTGRDGADYRRHNGARLTADALRHHLSDVLSGMYSLGGQPDRAIVQQRVRLHPAFAAISYKGIPDVRVVVYRNEPAMAMLRLPTKESGGKANLHQGGIGAGVDLETGVTHHAVRRDCFIGVHPDTKNPLIGMRVPYWSEVLEMSRRVAKATQLGYVGVDIVVDAEAGPMLLEGNARPGLAIQIANGRGLVPRLEAIDALLDRPKAEVWVNSEAGLQRGLLRPKAKQVHVVLD